MNGFKGRAQISWAALVKLAMFIVLPILTGLGNAQSVFADGVLSLAEDAVSLTLNKPAMITDQAQHGLFTAVVSTGRRLVAVGENGRILLSDDNGKCWRQVETPTSVTLTNIRFVTPQEGWAVGQMGVVLHTKDGGLTWLKQLDGVQANKIILAAAESDANTHPASLTAAANLLAAQQLAAGGPSVPFLDILPLSATNLLMTGGFGMSLRSKDGGASWQSIFDDLPNPNGMHIYRIFEARKKLYFLGEQGFAVSRDDDGSFTTVVTPFQGTFFGGLFTAKGTLLFYGLQGTILRSVDQGKSWTQPASNVTVGIVCGIVLRDGRILLGDVAGDLLLSNDDGKSFAVLEAAEPAVGLAQAEDGSVIVSGPQGFERLDPSSFNLRS